MLTAGHGRKDRHFVARFDWVIKRHHVLIHSHAKRAVRRKFFGKRPAAFSQLPEHR
jgi:hypothetical protein